MILTVGSPLLTPFASPLALAADANSVFAAANGDDFFGLAVDDWFKFLRKPGTTFLL